MANSVDPDQLASKKELIWIYTVCKGRLCRGSAGQWLIKFPLSLQVFTAIIMISFTAGIHHTGTTKGRPLGSLSQTFHIQS